MISIIVEIVFNLKLEKNASPSSLHPQIKHIIPILSKQFWCQTTSTQRHAHKDNSPSYSLDLIEQTNDLKGVQNHDLEINERDSY